MNGLGIKMFGLDAIGLYPVWKLPCRSVLQLNTITTADCTSAVAGSISTAAREALQYFVQVLVLLIPDNDLYCKVPCVYMPLLACEKTPWQQRVSAQQQRLCSRCLTTTCVCRAKGRAKLLTRARLWHQSKAKAKGYPRPPQPVTGILAFPHASLTPRHAEQ